MCDDLTGSDNAAFLARQGVSRRQLGGLGAAAVAAGLLGQSAVAQTVSLTERAPISPDAPGTQAMDVIVPTPDGECDAWFVAPLAGGPVPGVILWPDVVGLRDAYKRMATRLASAGFAVLVVNPYYRSARAPVLANFDDWRTDEGRARIAPMRALLTPDAVTLDGGAYTDWLDARAEVSAERKIGAMGYCMGGPFTFRTAAARPDRLGAIASFHGGGLVTDAADSPHRLIASSRAAMLVAIARNDDEREPEAKTALRAAADAAGRFAEIEVYPALHGWCTIDAPVFDMAAAERAWERMLALYRAHL